MGALLASQALWIGAVAGVVVGGLLMWLWSRADVRVQSERGDALASARDEALTRLDELRARVADTAASVADDLAGLSADADKTHGERAAAARSIEAELRQLTAPAGGSGELSGIEGILDELGERERALAEGLSSLRDLAGELLARVEAPLEDEDAARRHALVDDLGAAAEHAVQTAAAMEEVFGSLQDSAKETAQLSTQVSLEAERGYRAVHKTLDEIERIRDLTGAARQRIDALGERVAGIGHVVGVIQDITEKTNLLALNASIIAAQAGQHGRSFAVVAREIKALAHKTSASTKEITDQIRGVQSETARATTAMEDGVAAVGDGFQVAIAAGDALDAIRRSARTAAKRVQSMNRTVERQNITARVVEAAAAVAAKVAALSDALASATDPELRAAADAIDDAAQRLSTVVTGGAMARFRGAAEALEARAAGLERERDELLTRADAMRALAEQMAHADDELASGWRRVASAAKKLRTQPE